MGIKTISKNFVGKSVQIDDILNKEITVHYFKIVDSTKKEGTKCLYIQIEVDKEKRLLFSGSKYLLETIKAIKEEDFPFKTTIKKEYKSFQFT